MWNHCSFKTSFLIFTFFLIACEDKQQFIMYYQTFSIRVVVVLNSVYRWKILKNSIVAAVTQ